MNADFEGILDEFLFFKDVIVAPLVQILKSLQGWTFFGKNKRRRKLQAMKTCLWQWQYAVMELDEA